MFRALFEQRGLQWTGDLETLLVRFSTVLKRGHCTCAERNVAKLTCMCKYCDAVYVYPFNSSYMYHEYI
jgi:hypothetical protein